MPVLTTSSSFGHDKLFDLQQVTIFVAKDIAEESMVKEFVEFLRKQKDYVLYHWAPYEKTHMSKMMEK